MTTYTFSAMDSVGISGTADIDAANEEDAQNKIRQMGLFVTKISIKKVEDQACQKVKQQSITKRVLALGRRLLWLFPFQ